MVKRCRQFDGLSNPVARTLKRPFSKVFLKYLLEGKNREVVLETKGILSLSKLKKVLKTGGSALA